MNEFALSLRKASEADIQVIYEIINDAATAYKGVIPEECYHEPYMSRAELDEQIADGIIFECCERDGVTVGVMGLQEKKDVFLIRHAYVRTKERGHGIGSFLLKKIYERTDKPVLIGTWRDAEWAVNFYLKNGFTLVPENEKILLLKKYWKVPMIQSANSVVLADGRWVKKIV